MSVERLHLFISKNFEMGMVNLSIQHKDNKMNPTPRHARQDIRANEHYFLINLKKKGSLFKNSPFRLMI